jgi:glycosyltransferase involved in cell wall biosynthesis
MHTRNYDGLLRVYCSDSPGFGGSELNLIRVLRMTPSRQSVLLHSINAAPELLNLLKENHVNARAVFPQGNTVRMLLKGLLTTFRCIREFPSALFIVWCHHLDSNRWLQFGLALGGARFIIVEQLVPSDSSRFCNSRLTAPIKRFVSKRARFIVLNGYSQVEHYSRLLSIPVSRLRVIPNSRSVIDIKRKVDLYRQDPSLRSRLGLRINGKTVVCVGRLSEQKGQSTILDAIAMRGDLPEDLQVIFVGEGEKRSELESQAKKFPPGKIKLVGHCNDVIPYLAAADLFVLPSLVEGLPGALIEAMAAGLPCVATDIPGNRELIQHEQNGLIVPPNSPIVLASAMARVILDSTLASMMGIKAHEFVYREYDESKEKACWKTIFCNLETHASSEGTRIRNEYQ